jgi:hypothetical protein
MLPSRPAGGPFARSVREALESAVSPAAAQSLIADALERAGLLVVPEEIGAFRRFCEGPFRASVGSQLGGESIEQIFERLGHVLWMATSDVTALETAREWSRRTKADRDDDSGVRHVEPKSATGSQPRSGETALPTNDGPAKDKESGTEFKRAPLVPPPPALPIDARARPTSATIGRMRVPTQAMPAVVDEIRAPGIDRRSPSIPPPHPLPETPTPVRSISSTPPSAQGGPTTVLVVTLDQQLVSSLRQELARHCPVRAIQAPTELAGAVVTAGQRLVVLIDTALPSIDVPTFAGLAPILPAGARVVLWGASPRQQQRLVTMFPVAASWISSPAGISAGRFLLDLP